MAHLLLTGSANATTSTTSNALRTEPARFLSSAVEQCRCSADNCYLQINVTCLTQDRHSCGVSCIPLNESKGQERFKQSCNDVVAVDLQVAKANFARCKSRNLRGLAGPPSRCS